MDRDFSHTVLGRTGLAVHRLGLSASYRPGVRAVLAAADQGINYFFGYGFDRQLKLAFRQGLGRHREQYVLATGVYNYVFGHQDLRRTLERRLRQFGTEYLDAFLFLGVMKEAEFPERTRAELVRLREEGKVRAVGMSCHDRRFAGRLAAEGSLDVLMVRYNAAHRGAETEIFPHLQPSDPGVVSYTATRWSYLLRRPKSWPRDGRVPDAGLCYRFVLSNPNVHVCMMAPSNEAQLRENVAALQRGPLDPDELAFMRDFGDAVHHTKKWFM
jgi:aryl-alcohol dehydrogenase-like predicted oxidoreductase